MAFNERSLDDYIDVPQRIAEFREKYPKGSFQPVDKRKPFWIVAVPATIQQEDGTYLTVEKRFVAYGAAAYRTEDDRRPGIGYAWEQVPGITPYTRNSELMNAETSAWGRAIVAALAADSKRGIATRNEVANRRAERDDQPPLQPANGGTTNGAGPGAREATPGAGGEAGSSPAGTPGPASGGVNSEAQALADTAKRVRSVDSLKNVHDQATRRKLLRVEIGRPGDGAMIPLADWIQERKTELQVAENDPALDGAQPT